MLQRPGTGGFSDSVLPGEFASYTFRKLLKHLLAVRSQPLDDLERVTLRLGLDVAAIERYFAVLEEIGWLNRVEDTAVFTPSINDLGHTVEWYVAHLLTQHLHWQATTNVLLEGNKDGDFDVLAVLGTEIAYVECKTSSPDQVSNNALAPFLERHYFLQPAFALLLVDTSSSIQDLTERFARVHWKHEGHPEDTVGEAIRRIQPIDSNGCVLNSGINVYVGNASTTAANGLLTTLRLTLGDYSRHIRGKMVLGRARG
ncbi:MAG: hypothetical protein M3069_30400 [Chloroflexota bacterium]|nr:hypothetical protein [Chloroflexota bacterium]